MLIADSCLISSLSPDLPWLNCLVGSKGIALPKNMNVDSDSAC